jgi:hypothetical protein
MDRTFGSFFEYPDYFQSDINQNHTTFDSNYITLFLLFEVILFYDN